jgi:ferredoxin
MGIVKGKAVIITDLCDECGICAEVCPIGAVRLRLPHHEFPRVDPSYQGVHR